MLDIFAGAVVVLTFDFIIRGTEVGLALLAAGAVFALVAWQPEAWFTSFAAACPRRKECDRGQALLCARRAAVGMTHQ